MHLNTHAIKFKIKLLSEQPMIPDVLLFYYIGQWSMTIVNDHIRQCHAVLLFQTLDDQKPSITALMAETTIMSKID